MRNLRLKALAYIPILLIASAWQTWAALPCIEGRSQTVVVAGSNQPSDVCTADNGDLYLVDGVNNQIIVLDTAGRQKLLFGSSGEGPGEFNHPLGIHISAEGHVFIADSGNRRVQVFDEEGHFLYLFDVGTGSDRKPADPADVLASNYKGRVYVSDNDNHKIKVFNRQGRFQFEWGQFGEEAGEFRYPGILAINAHNELFVVDVLNTRVQKFDPQGNFLLDIGTWGVLPGHLYRPKGVAIDGAGRVLVGDSYMGVIQVFTDLGKFLGVFCEKGQKASFITPVGLDYDPTTNRLHVVEMRRHRIRMLQFDR